MKNMHFEIDYKLRRKTKRAVYQNDKAFKDYKLLLILLELLVLAIALARFLEPVYLLATTGEFGPIDVGTLIFAFLMVFLIIIISTIRYTKLPLNFTTPKETLVFSNSSIIHTLIVRSDKDGLQNINPTDCPTTGSTYTDTNSMREIDFADIKNCVYDPFTKRIDIYYASPGFEPIKYSIYDYFKPSLKEALENKRIEVTPL